MSLSTTNGSVGMRCGLDFTDVAVEAPPGTASLARIAAAPFIRYINRQDGHFPLEFQMVLDESQFEYQSSLAAAGLWTAVGESVNRVLASFGIELEDADETGDTIKERAKSVLERLRKPKDDKPER